MTKLFWINKNLKTHYSRDLLLAFVYLNSWMWSWTAVTLLLSMWCIESHAQASSSWPSKTTLEKYLCFWNRFKFVSSWWSLDQKQAEKKLTMAWNKSAPTVPSSCTSRPWPTSA